MASSSEFMQYVVDSLDPKFHVRIQKMFGEYMVYVENKPTLLVCDNTVYIKITDETSKVLSLNEKGHPYEGAKLHYILDLDDKDLATKAIDLLLPNIVVKIKKPKHHEMV